MKKNLKTVVLKATSKAVLEMAKKACGAASWWDLYQPKEPTELKKMCKKCSTISKKSIG